MRPILAIVLVACAAAPAAAGSIRGGVQVLLAPPTDATFRPYAGRASSLPAPARPRRGLPGDAVVYLAALPAGAQPHATATPQLAQRGPSFEPRVVVVAAGGEVEFPNFDPIDHNVFSVSPSERFDLGKYPRGQSRTVRFPKAGLVNVFCDIHSDMAAFILVTPTAAWAGAGADGRYELRDLPAGHDHARGWHPDFATGGADIEVPAAGAATLDVVFR